MNIEPERIPTPVLKMDVEVVKGATVKTIPQIALVVIMFLKAQQDSQNTTLGIVKVVI